MSPDSRCTPARPRKAFRANTHARAVLAAVLAVLALGTPAALASPGRVIRIKNGSSYQTQAKAGEGGYATVHAAHELRPAQRRGPKLAIKTFGDPDSGDLRYLLGRARKAELRRVSRSYGRELKNLRALQGIKGLPVLVDAGESENGQHLVLRWEGKPLHTWRSDHRPDVREVVRKTRETATILGRIHERGYLHLDVKPHNIMITDDDRLTVIDLGSAAPERKIHFRSGGSAAFMAPEQFRMGKRSRATDVFGLAGTLFYLATGGELPFEGAGDLNQLGRRHKARKLYAERAMLSKIEDPGLRAILHRALAPNPGDRYQSMAEFSTALEAWERGK